MLIDDQKYYFDGYYRGSFAAGSTVDSILEISNELVQGRVKNGFYMKSKYPSTVDLRPLAFQYDPAFLDVIFENDIPNIINNLVGYPLTLAHIQLRVAHPVDNWSYMTWHRDLYRHNGSVVGPVPSSHKLIFYPKLNGKTEDILGILPGSHLRQHETEREDKKYLSENAEKEVLIQNSDSEFVFYNASMLHATKPNTISQPRVIYNFCTDKNLKDFPENKELHEVYKHRVYRSR